MSAPQLTVFVQGQGVVGADELNTLLQGCDTLDQLQQFIGTPGLQVYLRGNSAPGDGGQGFFYWDAAASGPGNNTTIVTPNGAATGAWVRLSYDGFLWLAQSTSYANDAAAAAGGVMVGGLYRAGSQVMVRVS